MNNPAPPIGRHVFRIHCKNGVVIDVAPLPPDFNFGTTALLVRANGVFITDNIVIEKDNINFLEYSPKDRAVRTQRDNLQ